MNYYIHRVETDVSLKKKKKKKKELKNANTNDCALLNTIDINKSKFKKVSHERNTLFTSKCVYWFGTIPVVNSAMHNGYWNAIWNKRLQWFYRVIGRQRHTSTLESWTSIVATFAYFTWFAAGSEIGHSCRPIYLLEANRVRIKLPFPSIHALTKNFSR